MSRQLTLLLLENCLVKPSKKVVLSSASLADVGAQIAAELGLAKGTKLRIHKVSPADSCAQVVVKHIDELGSKEKVVVTVDQERSSVDRSAASRAEPRPNQVICTNKGIPGEEQPRPTEHKNSRSYGPGQPGGDATSVVGTSSVVGACGGAPGGRITALLGSGDNTVTTLSAASVAESLRSEATRVATLDALEALDAPMPSDLALLAAPALVDAMVAEEGRASFDRCGLLLARLVAEALPDATVHAAAIYGERLEAITAPALIARAVRRASSSEEQPLTVADARSYACLLARETAALVRGGTTVWTAAGRSTIDWMRVWLSEEPMVSQQKTPSDDVPRQMLTLLVELLRSGELPELAIGGAWRGLESCLTGRPGLGPTAMNLGLIQLVADQCRHVGTPADVASISRGKAERPDLAACVASGLFDICVKVVAAFAAAGVESLRDTDHIAVFGALTLLVTVTRSVTVGTRPGCEAKIRGIAGALAFCLENSLDVVEVMGFTTGSSAAVLCCRTFGRDEGGSEFTFQQQHIDDMTQAWSKTVRAFGYYQTLKPSADTISALELSISDMNKTLLLRNKLFIPYLVDALLLDPKHPRAGMEEEHRIWCQDHHIECLAQLAVYEPAREVLRQDPTVLPALQAVSESGLSVKARELAGAALLALSDRKLKIVIEGQKHYKHIMLSYNWPDQPTVIRINESLQRRKYITWLDAEQMKGSIMDA